MRFWIGLTLVLLPHLSPAAAVNLEGRYWKDIQIPASFIESFLNQEQCNSSDEYFKSCVEALKAAHEMAKPEESWEVSKETNFVSELMKVSTSNKKFPAAQIIGIALATQLRFFDNHADLVPSSLIEDQISKEEQRLGVGFETEIYDHQVRVTNVIPGSPSAKAGLRRGDILLSAKPNPKKTIDLKRVESDAILAELKGPPGKLLVLTVQRGSKVLTFKPRRRLFSVPNVTTSMEGQTGYVKVRGFQEVDTCSQVHVALINLTERRAKNFVIDLRGNGGGQLPVSVCVSSLFIGQKPIVQRLSIPAKIPSLAETFNDGDEQEPYWIVGDIEDPIHLPVVILVNGDVASASEIFAGAMQDHRRAWLVGDRTFGKGVVQVGGPIDSLVSGLWAKITRKAYYLPSGRAVQKRGLEPDFLIPSKPGEDMAKYIVTREVDFKNSVDVASQAWIQPRPAAVTAIAKCIQEAQSDQTAYAQLVAKGEPDYQLAYALAILGCESAQLSAEARH